MKVAVCGGADWVEIVVTGHAPGPPAGENLTCAAMSALMYAAAAVAEALWKAGKLTEAPEVELRPGYGRVAAKGEVCGIWGVAEVARKVAEGA